MGRGTDRVVVDGDKVKGRLFYLPGRRAYEGTCRRASGRYDRRAFEGSKVKRQREWAEWCRGLREADAEAARRERARAAARLAACAHGDRKEQAVAQQQAKAAPQAGDGRVWVLQVVGGPALFWFADLDEAARVSDALEAAAKASGFAAKYDVQEVARWRA